MKKSILITGVSGVGKTSISQRLNKMGYKAYDMDSEPELFSMIDKKTGLPVVNHDNSDIKKVLNMDWICNKEKLVSIIKSESNQVVFYCGSGSNLDELLYLFDKIVLLTLSPEIIKERLTTRTEHDFGKTAEIQDWIMSWKDDWENKIIEKGALVVNTRGTLEEIANDIIQKIGKS